MVSHCFVQVFFLLDLFPHKARENLICPDIQLLVCVGGMKRKIGTISKGINAKVDATDQVGFSSRLTDFSFFADMQ